MNKEQKKEVVHTLKQYFSDYNNFYITNTESLSVAQINALRRACFHQQVTLKIAKNTLIQKAFTELDKEKYADLENALSGVTALMFSENPKEPAVILSSFREKNLGDRPTLKAAMIDGAVYLGDEQLNILKNIKSKQELLGELIGLLQAPAQNVLSALYSGKNTLGGLLKTLAARAE